MNPASRIWDIPPPPGTEEIQLEISDTPSKLPEKEKSEEKEKPLERPIDRINPYLKNPEYIEYEKRHLDRKHKSRSRSHSRDRYHKKRYSRSRSRSKDRYRRSRSHSRRRRRRYSSSKSRSRSPSYRRHKYSRRRRSSSKHSRSRSKSVSRSYQRSCRSRSSKGKKSPSRKSSSDEREKPPVDVDISEVDMKIEEEDDSMKDNVFKNDGTFLEMFKKMQEQKPKVPENPSPETTKKPLLAFGKRRGGKVLKTGMVQKLKQQNEEEGTSQDAWTVYMKEVRKYKEACCDDDSKTRPLVK